MSQFHLLRPYWLLALIPLALLVWRLYRLARSEGDWRRVCDPDLLPFILIHDPSGEARRGSSWLAMLGGTLAILALAGPVWERIPTPAFRNEAALVIALDLSRIMEAGDLKPSRLERARFKIADILSQRKDGLTALVVYSGDAFTVTPLTDDSATIQSQLSALASDLMPVQGSRSELALQLSGNLLKQAGLTRGDVLLITNGVNLDKASSVARELNSQGYRVSVLGAGNEEGAPVPLPEGGFLQDGKGNIVISKLAAPALRQLASEGGGLYEKMSNDNSDLNALLALFERKAVAGAENQAGAGSTIELWEERGPWLLLALLPIAALAFRRGILAILLLLALPFPKPAQALQWQELWQTRDQRASKIYQSGDPARAAEVFENPAWKAAAQYQAGQYEEAAKTLQEINTADGRYNLGNALAKQGKYPEAIAAYDQALKLDPKNEDARHNKELVEKALKEQQKQSDKSQDKDQQKENGSQQEDQGKQNNKDQEDQSQKQGQQGEDNKPSQGKEGEKDQSGQSENKPQQNQQGQGQQEKQEQAKEQNGEEKEGQASQGERREQPQTEPKAHRAEEGRKSEDEQASEQWLRRIPDDPGGLLRRKFQYQYQQRQRERGQ